MVPKKANNFFRNNLWITSVLTLSISGIILSLWGFCEELHCSFSDSLYYSLQLLFQRMLDNMDMDYWQFQWARWLFWGAFAVASFRLFFEIIAPQFLYMLNIKFFYQNHVVICGVNKITINLIEKFSVEKIIVIEEVTTKYAEVLRDKGAKLLIGDLSDKSFLRKAKIDKACLTYIVTDNDQKNANTALTIFSVLEKTKRTKPLKCFVLIKDRAMITILEETDLFKCEISNCFEGILFNIDEMGLKYGISTNINKILPNRIEVEPELLLVGLTEKTEITLLNLAHCLTMKRESFKFTIVEENANNIRLFEKKYAYLKAFAEIEFAAEINPEKQFTTIIICIDNQLDAIKNAMEIYYLLSEKAPNIIVFCNEIDTISEMFNILEKKKIFLISLFEQIADYVFELDKHIEEKAKMVHDFWNDIYKMNKEWNTMSGHFKQSNRNQILDYFLKAYIAFGKKFDEIKNQSISFSDYDKDTLSMMEHRRWMLEKYADNWTYGKRDKENGDPYKRHDCLVPWNKLNEEQKAKDTDTVNTMIILLNNQME